MQLLPLPFAKGLVQELLGGAMQDSSTSQQPAQPEPEPVMVDSPEVQVTQSTAQARLLFSNRCIATELIYAATVYEQPIQQNPYQMQQPMQVPNEPQYFGNHTASQPVNVQPASFTSFQPYPLQESEAKNLELLMDIPLQVTVELGRTKRSIKEILELSSGSIIELDKLAGEPVDILVNNRLIAKGEVVVIDENFGVRVTDIVSQSDRLKKLR